MDLYSVFNEKEDNRIGVEIINVEELFKDNFYYIPKYQREYAWEFNKNILVLIKDLMEYDNYFLGNIMVDSSSKMISIIDGQQRVMSLYLILLALYKHSLNVNNEIIDDSIIYSSGARIKLGRATDANEKVLEYIYNDSIPETMENVYEKVQYDNIVDLINDYEMESLKMLYEHLKHCQIVVINTSKSNISAENVFLNINTKGVRLSNEAIIKSVIFSKIAEKSKFDKLKNSWFDTFKLLKKTEKDDYLTTYISIYKIDKVSKISKEDTVDYYRDIIKNNDDALEIYRDLCSKESIYRITYFAGTKNEENSSYSLKYKENFENYHISLDSIFDYIGYIHALGFKQFNIAIVAMLSYEKKESIVKNHDLIIQFLKWTFLYVLMNGIKSTSPSKYANGFIKFAVELRRKNNIPNVIADLIFDTFKSKRIEKKDLSDLDGLKVTSDKKDKNSNNLKYVKTLISFLDGNSRPLPNGEHVLLESGNDVNRFKFSNIIPVKNDDFKNLALDAKIEKYKNKVNIEESINIFLKKDYFKDDDTFCLRNDNWIVDRADRYKDEFVKMYNSLIDNIENKANEHILESGLQAKIKQCVDNNNQEQAKNLKAQMTNYDYTLINKMIGAEYIEKFKKMVK